MMTHLDSITGFCEYLRGHIGRGSTHSEQGLPDCYSQTKVSKFQGFCELFVNDEQVFWLDVPMADHTIMQKLNKNILINKDSL